MRWLALLVLGGTAACNLAMPLAPAGDPDATIRDGPKNEADSSTFLHDGPLREAVLHDQAATDLGQPDGAHPDLPQPDLGPAPLLDEDFASGKGNVTLENCAATWSAPGGELVQSSIAYNGCFVRYDVAATDYVAETLITLHSVDDHPSWAEGAGVGVRVQAGNFPPAPPGAYVCLVSPDSNLLALGECPGTTSNNCVIQKKTTVNIPLGQPLRLQAHVVGNTITCSLPDLGPSFTHTDSTFASGGVGLFTFYAAASYDYLLVTPP